jgi:hypothetical protein
LSTTRCEILEAPAGNGGFDQETRVPELRVHFRNRDSGYNRKEFGGTPLMNEVGLRVVAAFDTEAAFIGHSCDLSDPKAVTCLQSVFVT